MNMIEERFLKAALAEDGQPIAAGYVPAEEGSPSAADERFLTAARAEDGLPVSAGCTNGVPVRGQNGKSILPAKPINEAVVLEFGKEVEPS